MNKKAFIKFLHVDVGVSDLFLKKNWQAITKKIALVIPHLFNLSFTVLDDAYIYIETFDIVDCVRR